MKATFAMNYARMHMFKENTIVFEGVFTEKSSNASSLSAYINGNKQSIKFHFNEGLEIANKYVRYGRNITQEVIGEVVIPQGMELKNFCIKENDIVILSIKEKGMPEFVTGISSSIDYTEKKDDKIQIVGWIANRENAIIEVFNGNSKVQADIERNYRRDVKMLFPEADSDAAFGIKVTIPEQKYNDLCIKINDRERTKEIRIDVDKLLKKDENVNISESALKKAVRFYRTNGIKATTKKVLKKIAGVKENNDQDQYALFLKQHPINEEELKLQREKEFKYQPVISIVIPIYNTPLDFLKELIESVENQTYGKWELCLADGSDTNRLEEYVIKYSNADPRVKYKLLGYNDGISNNTNGAIEMATGEFIAFSDHDDLLTPDAMYYVVEALNSDDEIDCVYSDEDKIDMDGKTLFMPHFKPDYNIDLLCSYNYITHLFVTRKTLLDKVGWLRKEYDGSQDHDTILRCTEQARKVYHVPRVLYHWRCHQNSTAMNPESKMYCYEAGRKAVQAHWDRLGVPAKVEMSSNYGHYITKYNWEDEPLVSVIIPNMNHKSDLKICIDSILSKSLYRNIEIVIVENNSTEDEIFSYYKELEDMTSDINVRVVYYNGTFNYSKINNFGVDNANGEYILFLNNDTEMITSGAIKQLLDIARRDDVGAVGARLYYADGNVQHAGVVLGVGGVANHAFYNTARGDVGYFFRSISVQEYSAVTAACMMTKKAIFEKVEGFSEDLAVAFNDVDYCMKITSAGKHVVYTPFSEWYHYESKSRGYDITSEKQQRLNRETEVFMSRWRKQIEAGDPYYNPNFNHKAADFTYNLEA